VSLPGVQSPATESHTCAKRGGTLTGLNTSDFEHIDPGAAYYQIYYQAVFATQRPLYSYKPETFSEPTPDVAETAPEISSDAKTVTVRIRHGIQFSPPVNREVTAADVAYAIARRANPAVENSYFCLTSSPSKERPKRRAGRSQA
jgi:peptide/nickel transport system substrate-binding protein